VLTGFQRLEEATLSAISSRSVRKKKEGVWKSWGGGFSQGGFRNPALHNPHELRFCFSYFAVRNIFFADQDADGRIRVHVAHKHAKVALSPGLANSLSWDPSWLIKSLLVHVLMKSGGACLFARGWWWLLFFFFPRRRNLGFPTTRCPRVDNPATNKRRRARANEGSTYSRLGPFRPRGFFGIKPAAAIRSYHSVCKARKIRFKDP
jgi:hypothetical protein